MASRHRRKDPRHDPLVRGGGFWDPLADAFNPSKNGVGEWFNATKRGLEKTFRTDRVPQQIAASADTLDDPNLAFRKYVEPVVGAVGHVVPQAKKALDVLNAGIAGAHSLSDALAPGETPAPPPPPPPPSIEPEAPSLEPAQDGSGHDVGHGKSKRRALRAVHPKKVHPRASLVQKIMKEKKLSMIAASQYIKAHGMYGKDGTAAATNLEASPLQSVVTH
jgi:hypothetical protein